MDIKVEDLDTLRPPARYIILGGNKIDVSFIPCGITWEIDKVVQELSAVSQSKILENGEDTKKAFDLAVKLCSTFCSWKYPDMTIEWFMDNCDAKQIQGVSASIQEALTRAYNGINVNSKNLKASRKKSQ